MAAYRPKPAIAAWIARERKRLGMTPADLVARLRERGVEVSEQTVRVWESYADRKPSAGNLDALERIFDSQGPAAAPSGDAGLAAAINALVAELRAMREERDELAGWRRSVDAELALLGQRVGVELPERSAPRVKVE